MKRIISLESLGLFLLSIYLFSLLSYPWWVFPALLLLPDLSMIGYAFGPKVGAILYNFFHHQFLGIALYLIGFYFQVEVLQLLGIILFGHSAMDRIFGYGLKYFTGFQDTHLGRIGKVN
jgi:hypothetical protein